jgi:hypothetical protein
MNSHHCRWPPSPDHLTPTLHCYKKVISTLATLPTIQPHLYFASSLARAPCHQSSTYRCHSLSPSSHVHRPSAQWHPWWWTSWPSFTSRITYWHVNSHKKYFEIPQHRVGLSTSNNNSHFWSFDVLDSFNDNCFCLLCSFSFMAIFLLSCLLTSCSVVMPPNLLFCLGVLQTTWLRD